MNIFYLGVDEPYCKALKLGLVGLGEHRLTSGGQLPSSLKGYDFVFLDQSQKDDSRWGDRRIWLNLLKDLLQERRRVVVCYDTNPDFADIYLFLRPEVVVRPNFLRKHYRGGEVEADLRSVLEGPDRITL